jgi:hypothetical protein
VGGLLVGEDRSRKQSSLITVDFAWKLSLTAEAFPCFLGQDAVRSVGSDVPARGALKAPWGKSVNV